MKLTLSLLAVLALAPFAHAAAPRCMTKCCAACPPAPKVTLSRYMGPWHVIAFMDNKVERKFSGGVESYKEIAKGKIASHFAYMENGQPKAKDFTGDVVPDGTNAHWKMHIFPIFSTSYDIAYVAPDYSLAAVTNPSKKYGWVLARSSTISKAHYDAMMKLFAKQGYDTAKFIRMPQPKKA